MKRLLLVFSLFGITACSTVPDPKTLPPPPSMALNPQPLASSEEIALAVNAIPADAKYVIYAELKLDGLTIQPGQEAQVGADLSRIIDQVFTLARERGANLVVLLSTQHGVDLPIKGCTSLLRVRPQNPVITAILFQSVSRGASVPNVRFTTQQAEESEGVAYKITLALDTAGVTKAYWTYGNISRFVAEAVKNRFDTISITSTSDKEFEEVWLPGCDEPLRVSLKKPVLDVHIYRENMPNQPPLRTPGSGTPAASASAKATADKGAPVAPPSGAAGR